MTVALVVRLAPNLACEDDNCGLQSEAIVSVIAGNQYLVEVTGYSATSFGPGFLTIETTVPPPNDNCEDVTPVVLDFWCSGHLYW